MTSSLSPSSSLRKLLNTAWYFKIVLHKFHFPIGEQEKKLKKKLITSSNSWICRKMQASWPTTKPSKFLFTIKLSEKQTSGWLVGAYKRSFDYNSLVYSVSLLFHFNSWTSCSSSGFRKTFSSTCPWVAKISFMINGSHLKFTTAAGTWQQINAHVSVLAYHWLLFFKIRMRPP